MKQLLSIVLRNQFNLFYRFGYTFIPSSQLVEFDDDINDEAKEKIVRQFATVTAFEYDEEYLILHLEKSVSSESHFVQFEIQDIVAIYPLSEQAKTSIESKIDQRIRLEEPVFETILPEIEIEIEKKEVKKAIAALWTICEIGSSFEESIANIGLENLYNGLEFRRHGTKANKIRNGNYWEYLIAYDRVDYFPTSTLGYFYDAAQVFAFSKGHPTSEGSRIHGFLEKLNIENPAIKLSEIVDLLEKDSNVEGYIIQSTVGGLKQYLIAAMYLMLRDDMRRVDNIAHTKLLKNLEYLKSFQDSFNYAVVLLGAFFGFRKFYDRYYDALNLRFYKNYHEQKKIVEEKHPEPISKGASTLIEYEKTKLGDSINKGEELIALGAETIISQHSTEELKKPSYLQSSNPGNQTDRQTQYQNIIEEALAQQPEIKLNALVELIKKKTNQKLKQADLTNIIKDMDSVEIGQNGKFKTARRKSESGLHFMI